MGPHSTMTTSEGKNTKRNAIGRPQRSRSWGAGSRRRGYLTKAVKLRQPTRQRSRSGGTGSRRRGNLTKAVTGKVVRFCAAPCGITMPVVMRKIIRRGNAPSGTTMPGVSSQRAGNRPSMDLTYTWVVKISRRSSSSGGTAVHGLSEAVCGEFKVRIDSIDSKVGCRIKNAKMHIDP